VGEMADQQIQDGLDELWLHETGQLPTPNRHDDEDSDATG